MSQLQQLAIDIGYVGNPLAHPASVDFSGVPDQVAATLENMYQQLYQQHINNQLGDATYSWIELAHLTDTPLHNLGAVGRFLHQKYGQIQARYVQFESPKAALWTGAPVGYANKTDGFKWQVTNDKDKSHRNALIGLQAAYTAPKTGQYGWVIIEGINTQSLQFIGVSAPTIGDLLTWYSAGFVGLTAGAVVGRVASVSGITAVSPGIWAIPPAAVHITSLTR